MKALPARHILTGVFIASLLPFLMVEIFHSWLYLVTDISKYLVFHNIAEFFSVMVSLSIFGVGWFTYEQSRDRHILFLSAAFLAIGLMDFMHTLGYAGMPPFITPNSANKSTQYWIAVRFFAASAFLASAFIYPEKPLRWLTKRTLLMAAIVVPAIIFTVITFFPEDVPATFIQGVGLTPFKKISEYLIISLLILAYLAYWKRMMRTGDRLLVYYLAAFTLCIFSELVFAVYKSVFDTYNVLGHIYKVMAFFLMYKGAFTTSVNNPYVKLSLEIADHKQAKEEIRTLNAELEERVMERTAQLEAANEELEAFSYSVSHDLRAPLRAIDGYARILMEDYEARLDEEGNRVISVITKNAQRMGQLIDDILAFSRIGRREMGHKVVPMHDLAQEVFDELTRTEGERTIRFTLAPLPPAQGDPALIRQVLENLLSNSIKYTRPRNVAEIEVGCRCEEGENIYFVRDNGVGFDMKYSDKLFGVFQRLHGMDEFEGTGVGLAIVKRIVVRHGGRIWGEGKKDEGATFYFTLPAGNTPVSDNASRTVNQDADSKLSNVEGTINAVACD